MRRWAVRASSLRRRMRRAGVLRRVRLLARARGAHVDLLVAPDVEFGKGVRIGVAPGSRTRVRIGAGCRILDDVLILLWGGELDLGPSCEIRRGTVITLSGGRLRLAGGNKLSYYNVVHCSTTMTLEECASTAEHVSLVDSTHHHDGEHAVFYENTSGAPIHIGANSWIASKASVLMGVTVGRNCVVASHALANRDVPDGMVVGGVPARVLGPRAVGEPSRARFMAGGG